MHGFKSMLGYLKHMVLTFVVIINIKKCSIHIPPFFIKFIWGIIFYVSVANLYALFPIASGSSKLALLFIPMLICAFLIWHYTFQSHLKINKSVRKLQNLADTIKTSFSKLFESFCFLYFVLTYMFRVYAGIQRNNEALSRHFIQDLSFGALDIHSIDGRIATGIWLSYELIQIHFAYTIPDFVGMFFIIVCNQMTCLLNKYVIKSKNIISRRYITSNELENWCKYYNAIISTFNTINEIWSFPIFLICTYYSTIILFDSLLLMMNELDPIMISYTLINFI